MMRSLDALRATAPLCSWCPAPRRPLPVLTVAPQRTSHPQHSALPLLPPHQYGNSDQRERHRKHISIFNLRRARGRRLLQLPPLPHLCHNVGISHIEVIHVKFTAVGRRNGESARGQGMVLNQHERSVLSSNLFSVRAVRLKCRMSWCSGSGLLSFSSSSSPSSCSIAFWNNTCDEMCGSEKQLMSHGSWFMLLRHGDAV